jgi:3-hydroxyisobutyrate dehydrogenase
MEIGGSVAFLGAGGTMGSGMARNLAAAGIAVRAWNRSPEKLAELASDGAVTSCRTAAEAATGAELIITMLSDADAVLEVMEGDQGVAKAAADGAIWAQMSTIGLEGTERCAELARRAGLVFVDAPVLGTKQPAEAGELIILASGPDEARANLEPAFEAIGKRTMWVGDAGMASRLKVAINSWIVTVVEGAAETIALAEEMGVDPPLILDAISGGPLDLPYLRFKAEAMLTGDFAPSFRLSLAAKDADLAVSAARRADLDLPMLEAIAARMRDAAREHGDKDLSATYLLSAGDRG